jgi:hypothetical protein
MTHHFKKGDRVTLKPSRRASSRTQNRIHEKGPGFIVEMEATVLTHSGSNLDGRPCVCFKSLDHGWTGWLPLDEIHPVFSL